MDVDSIVDHNDHPAMRSSSGAWKSASFIIGMLNKNLLFPFLNVSVRRPCLIPVKYVFHHRYVE